MGEQEEEKKEPLFQELQADQDTGAITVESMCVQCGDNGITRLLLVKIPFFKEIILSSFECEHCGERNCEVQSGASIQDRGSRMSLKVTSKKDLDRQIVKQESASFAIPEIAFEAPAFTQKGEINTIEGLLKRAAQGLEKEQPVRKHVDPESAAKIDVFLVELKKCLSLEMTFTLVIDDISGNSFVENPHAPKDDPNMVTKLYERSPEQDRKLGFMVAEEKPEEQHEEKVEKDEVLSMQTNCSACNAPTETRMKVVSIPHFKEVIIMALTCDSCGYKTNEVKSGSGIEPFAKKLTLRITDREDLNRDVLKSETCYLRIPEVEFEVSGATLGGKFTTIEGLLTNVEDHLKSLNPFGFGDSTAMNVGALKVFLDRLKKIRAGEEMGIHIVLDDPAGNSYIQNYYAPDPDPELTVENYERTEEQNDELGLTDMKTENYGEK